MKNRLPSLSSAYAVIISVLCCAQSYVLFQNKQRLESDTSCPASSVVSSSVTALPRLPDSSSVPSDRPQSRRARLEAPPEPASPSQAPSTLDPDPDQIEPTQEETMGKSAYEEFQKKQIGKYRALQKIEAERTLSYLTDALGLHLSKQQKEMGLELLANAEDSEDLVSDKEVSFLSNRLELSAEQKNILRDSISRLQTASDEEVVAMVPSWNGSIPAEFHDFEGEIDTLRLRNEALSQILSPSLNPKQLKELQEIRSIEAVE